jgi:hypothetical protein
VTYGVTVHKVGSGWNAYVPELDGERALQRPTNGLQRDALLRSSDWSVLVGEQARRSAASRAGSPEKPYGHDMATADHA